MSIHIGPEKTLPAVVPHTLTAVAWNHNLPIPALTPNNLSKSSKSNKKHEDIWRHTWRDTWRHDTRPTPGQKHQRSKGTHQETHDQTQRGRMHMLNPTKRAHAQTHRDIIKFHTLILCSLYEFRTFILYSLHKFHTLIRRVCVCVCSIKRQIISLHWSKCQLSIQLHLQRAPAFEAYDTPFFFCPEAAALQRSGMIGLRIHHNSPLSNPLPMIKSKFSRQEWVKTMQETNHKTFIKWLRSQIGVTFESSHFGGQQFWTFLNVVQALAVADTLNSTFTLTDMAWLLRSWVVCPAYLSSKLRIAQLGPPRHMTREDPNHRMPFACKSSFQDAFSGSSHWNWW